MILNPHDTMFHFLLLVMGSLKCNCDMSVTFLVYPDQERSQASRLDLELGCEEIGWLVRVGKNFLESLVLLVCVETGHLIFLFLGIYI